jgi:phosphate transport system substrate-binding protein
VKALRWLMPAVLGAAALGAVACGEESSSGSGGGLSGTIAIDGSSTVFPFAQAAAEQFMAENPDVKITVGQAGTSGGFEKFCAGEIDISDASRPIDPKEEAPICQKENIDYRELQVAEDGISIVSNPAIEVSCLTTDQLKQYWEKGSNVSNLSDLGDDADTGDPLPDVDLSGYGPGTDSGTFEFFTEEINGEEGNSRTDYQASEDDNVLVEGVTGDPGGFGYFGFSYYEQNTDELNLISVDDGKGCVAPSVETIQSGEYSPLSRPLFMYPSEEALQKPEVEAFLEYTLDNYQQIAETAQIVPMSEDSAQKSTDTLSGGGS